MPEPQWYSLAMLVLLASACPTDPTLDGGSVESDGPACLRTPWYPKRPPAGVLATMCSHERSYRFVLGTGEPVSNDAEDDFLNAHRTEIHAIDGVVGSGFGLCCVDSEASEPQCVVLTLRLCSTPLPELIDKLGEMQANDEQVAKRALRVSVELEGLTGPRCEKGAPGCGPLPYDSYGDAGAPPQNRTSVQESEFSSQTCSYDGECVKNRCGNGCDHWLFGEMAGGCIGILALEGAFCGCVDQHCAWFR